MELSEGIYEDLHCHPNDGEYANVGAKRPEEVKGHHVWKRLVLALVGLLCVLLLAVITGLFATTTAERNQCQSDFSSLQARLCKLEKDVKQYAVDVTLDPETAHPSLILSADGKQVRHSSTRLDLPANPKRFDTRASVLGKKGFSSGRFYYEVQVSEKKGWFLGVTRESSIRKGTIKENPENGYWTVQQSNWTNLWASADSRIPLKPLNKLERVGVFVDYEAGLVSFYNADHWDLLYSFKHAQFNGTIYPFFNPNNNKDGQNSSPLVIHTPVACQYHDNE